MSPRKSSKSHSFDPQIALEVGIESAVVLNHFHFWLEHNRISGKAQEEGKTWTFQSLKSMGKYLPYLSQKQLRMAIDKLVDAGYIIKGNFNKNKFDRTAWYSIPDSKPADEEDSKPADEEDLKKEYDVPSGANRELPGGQINVPSEADPSYIVKESKEDLKQQQQVVVCCSKNSLTKDDIHFYVAKFAMDWRMAEIDQAFEAYKQSKSEISDPFAYFAGIINKKRNVIESNKEKPWMTKYAQKTENEKLEKEKPKLSDSDMPGHHLAKLLAAQRMPKSCLGS